MTRLLSNVKDLELRLNDRREVVYFAFGIGRCDNFDETLRSFKAAIPYEEREYNGEKKRYTVVASSRNETRLASLFDNWVEAVENAKAQRLLI